MTVFCTLPAIGKGLGALNPSSVSIVNIAKAIESGVMSNQVLSITKLLVMCVVLYEQLEQLCTILHGIMK